MKFKLNGNVLTVEKEDSDLNFSQHPSDESRFLYHVKQQLNSHGLNLIKKLMWKDNHLYGNDKLHYLRCRNKSSPLHIYIYDNYYAIRSLTCNWNIKGCAELSVEFNVLNLQPECYELTKSFFGDLK